MQTTADFWARLATSCDRIGRLTSSLGRRVEVAPHELIWGRSELLGLSPPSQVSAGGSCRLLEAVDGWWAINLARHDDVDSVPAIVEHDCDGDDWRSLETWGASRPATEAAARAQLLGVAAAAVRSVRPRSPVIGSNQGTRRRASTSPVVVDLSAMWAGPLCANLLGRAGAEVTKVETPDRPDGARATPAFFDALHAGHRFETIDFTGRDFTSRDGATALVDLVARADVVIESSRPRALRQCGIVAEDLVAEHGLIWIAITGYGRDDDRVAFGDDAAVAGGLVVDDVGDRPRFFGDAAADPLAGLAAAVTVFEALAERRAGLFDVSMAAAAQALAPMP